VCRGILALGAVLGLACSGLRAEEPLGCRQLRAAIDAQGRVVDAPLRERTGWRVIRAFAWRIELESASRPGEFRPVEPSRVFHSGERFRIQIEAFCDLTAYVTVHNADGSCDVLLPMPGERAAKIRKGQTILLPPDGTAFRFQPPGGTHTLRIVATASPLPSAEAGPLWKLVNGQAMPPVAGGPANSTAARRAVPRVAGLESAIQQIDGGKLAKGVVVELVEPAPEANLVALTSSDPAAQPILVHDLSLRQTD